MRTIATFWALMCLVLLAVPAWSAAADAPTTATKTVNAAYPGLAAGALSYATLGDLDGGLILKSASVSIAREDLEKAVAQVPESAREEMRSNLFFLLEQRATESLLARLAREKSPQAADGGAPLSESQLVRNYFQTLVAAVTASDADVAKFYQENKDAVGGAPLDKVRDGIKQYVLQQKQQEAVDEHIRTLGQRQQIVVSAAWTKEQAALAMDNPVDLARRSGKPSLVDFGAAGCGPCDMMAPILDDLKEKFAGRMNVEFVPVREKQVLAARYGIQSIPVQILFDKDGKEVWRHTGFVPQEDLEGKFAQVGVK